MKFSTFLAASSVVSGLAAAGPLNKRDVVWITQTNVVTTTVDIVKTVYVDGPTGQATDAPVIPASNPEPLKQHQHHHHQSGNAPALAPQASVAAAPSSAPAPAPAPAPAKTHTPKPAPAPAPAPAASSAPAPASSGSSGSSSSGTMSGDMTYYAVGLGSCGWTSTPNENVVALSYLTMDNGANPNDNPLCGKMITIHYGGKTVTAKVVDTCMGCQGPGDLDMSTGLFSSLADMSIGRITSGMTWSFD